ncbi:MAG TPA: GNAT family N-acetyltransferase [Myxococcota bacterium]|nr:GNAT family N-acetyltransferase [Myxococcota bacterium]
MNAVEIRRANSGDAAAIVAFNRAMAKETEDRVLDETVLLAGVRAVMNDPAKGFYLLAERRGSVVGQLMVTSEWSDWRNADFWWIQSVYVEPSHRRQGIFRALYAYLYAEARKREGICGIRLYAERENKSAHAVYLALGMQPARYQMFELDLV